MSEKTLVKKLAQVMKQVKYIQKRGKNKFHNYTYATESDVSEKIREELAERNVMMIPSVVGHSTREHTNQKGNREYICTVDMQFTFLDGDSGETITFNTIGEGQDAGDKGPYKAITGAQKYALMKAFMIPTGDDPEADEGVDQRNTEPPKSGEKAEPNVTSKKSATIKAKYQSFKGTLDGFDDFYLGCINNGWNEAKIEKYLTEKLAEMNKGEN
ncbi:ERF family protein [Brevibacillus sp. MER 51]|uniref:ERF family protein n=1 Tax=Brevibacillus sp. MER 51 TaxID=2939560 RepID=UPI00203E0E53|nr:ERF family protein [Brevibacillus sp. MER 51]MCM3141701.1 ERF family protein [Brevibacillus sp. MER 51]